MMLQVIVFKVAVFYEWEEGFFSTLQIVEEQNVRNLQLQAVSIVGGRRLASSMITSACCVTSSKLLIHSIVKSSSFPLNP